MPADVRRFLDFEAQVGDDDDSGDEGELEGAPCTSYHFQILIYFSHLADPFIDDDDIVPTASGSGTLSFADLNELGEDWDRDLTDILDGIHQRSQAHRRRRRGTTEVVDDNDLYNLVQAQPNDLDYPLWRVSCRVSPLLMSRETNMIPQDFMI